MRDRVCRIIGSDNFESGNFDLTGSGNFGPYRESFDPHTNIGAQDSNREFRSMGSIYGRE